MKTKDFIKLLREEDPTGEHHVRLSGGIPLHAILVEGYYDGPYSYFDEENNFVITDKNDKLDIHCEDLDDFIWENKGDISKIKVEVDVHDKERILQNIEKISREAKTFQEKMSNEMLCRVIKKLASCFQIVQPDHTKIGTYNLMWFIKDLSKFVEKDKNGVYIDDKENQIHLCQGECDVVIESGFFNYEHLIDLHLYKWFLKQ